MKVCDTITGSGLDGYKIVSVTTLRDIRATRDRLGLSTAELARLVGVENRTAHGWLAGRPVPEPVWRLLALMEVWRARDREIMDGDGSDRKGGLPDFIRDTMDPKLLAIIDRDTKPA